MNLGERPSESPFTPFRQGTIVIDDWLTHGCAGGPRSFGPLKYGRWDYRTSLRGSTLLPTRPNIEFYRFRRDNALVFFFFCTPTKFAANEQFFYAAHSLRVLHTLYECSTLSICAALSLCVLHTLNVCCTLSMCPTQFYWCCKPTNSAAPTNFGNSKKQARVTPFAHAPYVPTDDCTLTAEFMGRNLSWLRLVGKNFSAIPWATIPPAPCPWVLSPRLCQIWCY